MRKQAANMLSKRRLGTIIYMNSDLIRVTASSGISKNLPRARCSHTISIYSMDTWWKGINSDWSYSDTDKQPSVLMIGFFRRADCDTDHYLLVAKAAKKLPVSKRATRKSNMEITNLKNYTWQRLRHSTEWIVETGSHPDTPMMTWTSTELGKSLEKILQYQYVWVSVITNWSSIDHGSPASVTRSKPSNWR
jgi:hypothetical protein